jgi:predicted nucleic acid-binding protein
MTAHFVDTYYLLALVNTKDAGHDAVLRYRRQSTEQLVTTCWVLVEFADALSAVGSRLNAAGFLREFLSDTYVEVIPPTWSQFDGALKLYENRSDKEWSLTDCISFCVMQERGITDALTADRHFEQAGFRALLREADL